jgi:hypothetical protein
MGFREPRSVVSITPISALGILEDNGEITIKVEENNCGEKYSAIIGNE